MSWTNRKWCNTWLTNEKWCYKHLELQHVLFQVYLGHLRLGCLVGNFTPLASLPRTPRLLARLWNKHKYNDFHFYNGGFKQTATSHWKRRKDHVLNKGSIDDTEFHKNKVINGGNTQGPSNITSRVVELQRTLPDQDISFLIQTENSTLMSLDFCSVKTHKEWPFWSYFHIWWWLKLFFAWSLELLSHMAVIEAFSAWILK